jgi:chromosome segregation protein
MLYLKSLSLERFKSFRHVELLFSRGFTCVVGPNGSGKSVIFDSIMFGLGEPSLQALRVDRLEELINRNVKKKAAEPALAHVKMEFFGEGGEQVNVLKTVRSDSKASYRLNGKAATRKEVLEVLSKGGVHVDDTTTIAQGEINSIAELNSGGRRDLIDTAAGISEFEYKKGEAMKELEKVDQKIGEANIMLSERQGVLDELEKDKENAENYTRMTQRLKSLRYSVLLARQQELRGSFDLSTKEIVALESKKSDAAQKLTEISSKRELLGGERQQITRELNGITTTSGETNAKLDTISRELAKLEVEVPALQKAIDEAGAFVSQSTADMDASLAKVKENKAEMDSISKKVTELEKELAKMGIVPEGIDLDADLSAIDSQIVEEENRLVDLQGYISKLQADLSLASARKAEESKRLVELEHESGLAAEKSKARDDELSEAKKKAADMMLMIGRLDQDNAKLSRRLFEIDGTLLGLKEQRAVAQSREGNVSARIAEKFGEKDGFYGKASKLCKYESSYAYAIEAAASSRFEYFVVDSMATANSIIGYLKKNNIGKATFIPIAELGAERPQKQEAGARPVIDLVRFDSKLSKVFSYIFSNTYLISSIMDSKKYGVGKHRYVTLEGDLVEQSGVVSGGYSKRISLASIEARIKELEAERESTRKNADLAQVGLKEAEKQKALIGMQIQNITAELQVRKADANRQAAAQHELRQRIKAMDAEQDKINREMLAKDKEKLGAVTSLEERRKARGVLYARISAATKGIANSSKFKEQKEKSEKLRSEIEANKIRKAELNKEAQLLEQKAADADAAIAARKKQAKAHKAELGEKAISRDVLLKSKAEIEKQVISKNESAKKYYDRLSAIDGEISRLSAEYGKLDAEQSSFERQISDIKVKRSQSETRLNDITAELTTYAATDAVKGRIDEMETEANILVAKIEALGNVNLRAPELYEERRKMAGEARSRVDTLKAEKDAVLRMIEEIDSKKLQTFMETLNEVNRNFARLYNYVFPGKATLALEDERDPLNSGIRIRMTDGRTEIPLKSLSGGQKSMIALMLLFSIHMCKKSSLYLFDEVDAALDPENAKLLSKLVKEMSREAQFIVISHNNSLIVNADTAIGVTMSDSKESTAVGLEVASVMKSKQQ